jgi:hypothetical protein
MGWWSDWYHGKAIPYKDDIPGITVIGLHIERHWTARVVRAIVELHRKEWKWVIGVYLAVIALLVRIFSPGAGG